MAHTVENAELCRTDGCHHFSVLVFGFRTGRLPLPNKLFSERSGGEPSENKMFDVCTLHRGRENYQIALKKPCEANAIFGIQYERSASWFRFTERFPQQCRCKTNSEWLFEICSGCFMPLTDLRNVRSRRSSLLAIRALFSSVPNLRCDRPRFSLPRRKYP